MSEIKNYNKFIFKIQNRKRKASRVQKYCAAIINKNPK